jgi:hypothetical protein
VVGRFGFELRPTGFRTDFESNNAGIIRRVLPYTMTTPDRVYALIQAVRYVVDANIPGSIVECGVWRGGSVMAAAYALKEIGRTDIDFYLFDTYEGMSSPDEHDVDTRGKTATDQLKESQRTKDSLIWAYAPLEDVQRNMAQTGYDLKRLHYIKGRVEDTLPAQAPAQIALLRLDTDWYTSTRHELEHLFPRLAPGGVLLLDDYGWWKGSGQAVDEYMRQNNIHMLLNRIDNSGRIGVKVQEAR